MMSYTGMMNCHVAVIFSEALLTAVYKNCLMWAHARAFALLLPDFCLTFATATLIESFA